MRLKANLRKEEKKNHSSMSILTLFSFVWRNKKKNKQNSHSFEPSPISKIQSIIYRNQISQHKLIYKFKKNLKKIVNKKLYKV